MAQATVLASGDTRATSTDIPVASGSTVTVGMFVSSGVVGPGMRAIVYIDTPGADNKEVELDHRNKQTVLAGPGTFRVTRVEGTFGVYTE